MIYISNYFIYYEFEIRKENTRSFIKYFPFRSSFPISKKIANTKLLTIKEKNSERKLNFFPILLLTCEHD